MIPGFMTQLTVLVLGNLYPAYASYKAVRTKNVREYVKWMMYWIVFATFTCIESVADVFIGFWFPFYYEVKILILIWLISPVSRGSLGSSIIYRKFVHPNLTRREEEIDHMILKMQEQGYNTVTRLAAKAFRYVSDFVMQTAIRNGPQLAQLFEDEVDGGRGNRAIRNEAGGIRPFFDYPEIQAVRQQVDPAPVQRHEQQPADEDFEQMDFLAPGPSRHVGPGRKTSKKVEAAYAMQDFSSGSDVGGASLDMDVDYDPNVTIAKKRGRKPKAQTSEEPTVEKEEAKSKRRVTKKKV